MKKLLSSAYYKLCAMFGGAYMLPLVYALLAVSLAAVGVIMRAETPDRVSVAVVDECGGELSGELVSLLTESDGIGAIVCADLDEAQNKLLSGAAETLLRIDESYDDKLLASGSSAIVELQSAPGAVSAELVREAVAGLLAAQRSKALAVKELERDGFDTADMRKYMDEFVSPAMYSFTDAGGAGADRAVFGSGYACYEGVAAFAILLLMLTLARRLSDSSSRLVAFRLRAAKHGRALAFLSDVAALFTAGIIAGAIAFAIAPDKSSGFALGLVGYDICVTGLCLLTAQFGSAGRIDIAAPFIALVTSLIGGCFADLSALSPVMSLIAKFTPQGQLIACACGKTVFALLLAAEGIFLALLALLIQKKKQK